ncbi:ParB domain protein nuclease [Catenulispora acidiphila DSM 44928]|uniref:ParB domain protein nuclease n=2 Tax=Catenulispora TaxID=414878 RepID=C7Q4H1_CATAD|nr:ParB domain protein nuclease [Catenulispora acidiphila DSM 44928]
MPIANITIGTRCRKDLGKLRDLQRSIRVAGLLTPIPVTADGQLIAGERRLRACRNLGWERVPVIVAANGAHAIDLIRAEHNNGPHSLPMSATELTRLGMRIEEHGHELAVANRAHGHSTLPDDIRVNLRALASEIIQMPEHHYSRVKTLVLAAAGVQSTPGGYDTSTIAPDARNAAREALELVDRVYAGEEIRVPGLRVRLSTARIYKNWVGTYRHIQEPLDNVAKGDKAALQEPLVKVRTMRIDQREALAKGLSALTGLCHGLASINSIDPAMTREEAASFERDLSNASRVLRGLHNKIKEYANGNA